MKKTIVPDPKRSKMIQELQPNKTCKCGACEPPQPKLPDGMRRLKICNKWKQNGDGHEPSIRLQGEWLRNAGFEHGGDVLITVKPKQLIINFQRK
ncbi:SymE family type I addiction module toxin [Pedobacter sp. AW31-3R]|uniref:SymE family type I addiction module toxin n=1 Tax=Pedobacter sp. AW31-3R TaxID=3445781 RepID=UPI003FA03EB2